MVVFQIEEDVKELKKDCEIKFDNIDEKITEILIYIGKIEKNNKEENYDKFKEFKYEYDYKLKNIIEKYDYKYNLLEKKVYNLLIVFVVISLYNAYNSILYKTV